MIRIYIIKNDEIFDVSGLASDISWKYDIDGIAGELTFSLVSAEFGTGNVVVLKDKNKEVFRGIIVSEEGKEQKSFTCLDFGWYLSKNEIIVQFKDITVYQAVLHVMNKFGIPTELPDNLKNVKVTKIYKDVTVADILRDLLDFATLTTNNRYYMRMFSGVLAIRTYHRETIPIYGVGVDYSYGKSIENMYNKVLVVANEEESQVVYAELDDKESIKKYGMLQLIETAEADDMSQAKNLAKNKLKEVNKIEENLSLNCIGNYDLVPGRKVSIENLELKDTYVIKDVTHVYNSEEDYFCDLTLERWSTFVNSY